MVARVVLPGLAYRVTGVLGLDPRDVVYIVTDVLATTPDGGDTEGVLFGAWSAEGEIEALVFGAWSAEPDPYEPELETWSG